MIVGIVAMPVCTHDHGVGSELLHSRNEKKLRRRECTTHGRVVVVDVVVRVVAVAPELTAALFGLRARSPGRGFRFVRLQYASEPDLLGLNPTTCYGQQDA